VEVEKTIETKLSDHQKSPKGGAIERSETPTHTHTFKRRAMTQLLPRGNCKERGASGIG